MFALQLFHLRGLDLLNDLLQVFFLLFHLRLEHSPLLLAVALHHLGPLRHLLSYQLADPCV